MAVKESLWTVYKYKFAIEPMEPFVLQLPKGARPLRVGIQESQPCLWAMVDSNAEKEPRTFLLVGTGHEIEEPDRWDHVTTFYMAGGKLIWHVFVERQA